MFQSLRISALITVAALAFACGDDGPTDGGQTSLCAAETRADTYVAGMEKQSAMSMFEVRLIETEVDAVLTGPDRGDNVWELEVRDGQGNSVQGAAVVVRTWMPDHGHGTSPNNHPGTETSEAGHYRVGPFNVFMGGYWEFTVNVTSSSATDSAKFSFCIEG